MTDIRFRAGRGGLPKLDIATARSTAEIYLHGAQVTHFQKAGETPLLFLSAQSRFEPNAPIRGGIPIIFPWFGKPAGKSVQHGFVRHRSWALDEINASDGETCTVRLSLPPCPELGDGQIRIEYIVTIRDALTAELIVANQSRLPFEFENCLHTYFVIGDIRRLKVMGLQGVDYLDSLDGQQRKSDHDAAVQFTGEVDRAYLNTSHAVQIQDPALSRTIRVTKSGSASTVVWNPWIAKSRAMTDFGDDEYQRMVCVESGNVADDRIHLAPGAKAALSVQLASEALQ